MKLGERSCVLICQTPSIVFEFGLLMHRETISYSVSFPHEGEFMSSSSYEDQLFGSVVRMLFDFGREEGRSKNTSSKTNYDQRIFCSKVPCQKKAVSEIRRIVHFSFPKFPRRIVTQLSCSRCFWCGITKMKSWRLLGFDQQRIKRDRSLRLLCESVEHSGFRGRSWKWSRSCYLVC